MPPDDTHIENDDTHIENDGTHIENDGTPWKNIEGDWFYWREIWGWCPYVGPKNSNFFNKFS